MPSSCHNDAYYSGDEYGIVVLSTVRSLPIAEIINPQHVQPDRGWLFENLGFLTDAHQLNVGITRSKYGLIIVGKCVRPCNHTSPLAWNFHSNTTSSMWMMLDCDFTTQE